MRIAAHRQRVSRTVVGVTRAIAESVTKAIAATSIAAIVVSTSACSAAAPTGAAKEAPPSAPVPPGGKPAGKISPEMVGTLSPIPAFMGRGESWRIEILALDATQHHVALLWPASGERATGTARYDGPLGVARDAGPLVLSGMLERRGAKRALRIEIRAEACVDADGIARPQRIAIEIGSDAALRGCGDSAMY